MKESLFMQDSWHSNHGYEAMLDFQMSWLMRLAAEKDIEKPQLYKISKDVLLRLIEIGNEDKQNVTIENVKVWRQWKSIDVIAEGDIKVNELEGLKCFESLKENIKSKYNEEGEDYVQSLEYYLKNFETIVGNKKPRAKRTEK